MQKDMCDLSAIPHAVNEPGMKISDCTGILNELISGQLVSFRRKRNISKRIFNLRTSVGYHALNEFPWKTADDQFIVVAKDADRSNQPAVAIPPKNPYCSIMAVLAPALQRPLRP